MEKEKILGYKIRHLKTKLYLSSVSKKKWTKVGKTWPRRGDAIRAVNQGLSFYHRYRSFKKSEYEEVINDIANWEIVELSEISAYPILFLIDKIKIGE
tara:strand:+ start:164 stop:457 length:294 start_codon:yes stop_codon:yes gene_type:complete